MSYARLALQIGSGHARDGQTARRLRGLDRVAAAPEVGEALRAGVRALRAKLEDHALPMLQQWYAKLRVSDEAYDACTCIAHMAFICGAYREEAELDDRAVFVLLSSRVFINMHHGDLDSANAHDDAAYASASADGGGARATAGRRPQRRASLADVQRGSSGLAPLGFPALELVSVWQVGGSATNCH